MKLFTFIVEADGGTFISQVLASSLPAAGRQWLGAWCAEHQVDEATRQESIRDLAEPDF